MIKLRNLYRFSIENYVLASRIGGSSEDNFYDLYKGKFVNTALFNLKKSNRLKGTTIVTNENEAKQCLEILLNRCKNKIVACDTETIDIDVKKQVPIGHGKVVCLSVFAGPQVDFGNGPRLFIQNFGITSGLLDIFKPFLQSPDYLKAWHNYSFDRHVLYNHDIDVKGLGGDTMHMGRLFDASKGPKQYSLAKMTESYKVSINSRRQAHLVQTYQRLCQQLISTKDQNQKLRIKRQMNCLEEYKNLSMNRSLRKTKIEDLFKRKKTLIGGKQGKSYEYPSVITLHTSPEYIQDWVQYSSLDSESTYYLRETLQYLLKLQVSKQYPGIPDMWQLYQKYWRPFGEVLTDIERQGIKINLDHIQEIQKRAREDLIKKEKQFINFVKTFQDDPNIDLFNPSSSRQMQQLLHAPFVVQSKPQPQEQDPLQEELDNQADQDVKIINRKVITQLPFVDELAVRNQDPTRGNKNLKIKVMGLGIPAGRTTPTGLPSVDAGSLRQLAGTPKQKKYGKAYQFFKQNDNENFGIQLCQELDKLCELRNIQTLLTTFIEPLSGYVDKNSRVHCSLNINTETGRLSARKPNLQNQPALDKDIYKIRQAFQASPGKKLIVADYGQLELRVLAHMTNCKAMIEAFEKGGDFHSRTAIGMFPKIKQDIQNNRILLEWDKSKGEPPVPLLKDKYASQRKKAKVVNFSIAYGKTAHGFAQDWDCSIDEAIKSLDLWYSDRPQVKQWQENKKRIAKKDKLTQTFLGRFRFLFKYFLGPQNSKKRAMQSMAMRRAINTPIQGGAADIVIAAMVNIHRHEQLRRMGWRLLLQVHDQLILQGPQQSATRALEIVKEQMGQPFQEKLKINLEVDAKIGNNWYECK